MSKSLAVGSVFTGHGLFWYDIQLDFLRRMTEKFDHFVYLNADTGKYPDLKRFNRSTVIGYGVQPLGESGQHGHIRGLNEIGKFFRGSNYQRFLILDSDCFPIRPDWQSTIHQLLDRYDFRIAANMRCEELNSFPHVSAIYSMDSEPLHFSLLPYQNFLGMTASDVQMTSKKPFLPLIKTNSQTLHPTIGCVYGDIFYHHGAGSRHFQTHSGALGYYDHIEHWMSPEELYQMFRSNPDKFISQMRNTRFDSSEILKPN